MTTASEIDLHAIIVTYNSADVIAKCISSLELCGLKACTLIDNASTDGTIEVARAHSNVEIIDGKRNVGLARATNLVAHNRRASHVLLVNPDISIERSAAKALFTALADPSVGVVGPRLIYPDGKEQHSARSNPTFASLIARRTLVGRTIWGRRVESRHLMMGMNREEPDWLLGACMVVRGETWDTLRGMDESFFLYCEDLDLCARTWKAGWRVRYLPNCNVVHAYHRESHSRGLLRSRAGRHHVRSMIRYQGRRMRRYYQSPERTRS